MNPYFEQMVLGASPVELIRLLYQKAVSSVRGAREHLAAKRIEERSKDINRAYAVVAELMGSLSEDDAPEIAAQLKSLYCYILERLVEANLYQTDAPLAEVLGLLTTLSEAWVAAPEPAAAPRAQSWMTGDGVPEERLAFTA